MDWDDLHYVPALTRGRALAQTAEGVGDTHTPDGFLSTAAGQELAEATERMEVEVLCAESRVLGVRRAPCR